MCLLMPGDNDGDGGTRAPDAPALGEAAPPPSILDLDHVYEALSHPRRRYLCYTLFGDGNWTLRDLAVRIAAREEGCPEHAVGTDVRDSVYVSLYHVHVPKLVQQGVIGFDEATGMVSAGERAGQVLAARKAMGDSLGREDGGSRPRPRPGPSVHAPHRSATYPYRVNIVVRRRTLSQYTNEYYNQVVRRM